MTSETRDTSTFHLLQNIDDAIPLAGFERIKRKPVPGKQVSPNRDGVKWTSRECQSRVFVDADEEEKPLPEWSSEPRRLGFFGRVLLFNLFTYAVMVLLTLPFFILGVAVASVHGKRVNDSKLNVLQEATIAASTLFTLIFAAVVGQAARKIATWRLEQGSTLGLLEQLMQSRTVFAAVTTQISLRAYNYLGLSLVMLWILSPFGSQSSLRLLSTKLTSTSVIQTVPYVDTMGFDADVFDGADHVSFVIGGLKPVYVTSLLGPPSAKNGTQDLWGNVKIPFLSQIGQPKRDEWLTVSSSDAAAATYSSLVGIPIAGLRLGNATFLLESTYMALDCSQPVSSQPVSIDYNVTWANATFRGPNTTTTSFYTPKWQLALDQFVDPIYYSGGYPGQFINETDITANQGTLLFQSPGAVLTIPPTNDNGDYAISYCKINQEYVESNVTCEVASALQNCSVTAQRRSQLPHPPSEITSMSFPGYFDNFARQLILATGDLPRSGFSSIAEYYLQDPSTTFILKGNDDPPAAFGSISAAQMSVRLGQLMNTFQLGSQVYKQISSGQGSSGRNTTATVTVLHEVYVCSWSWLTVFFVATSAMFVAALASAWCGLRTTIPDVLGYCSSLTRDSRHLKLRGGGTLDGMERARLLKDYHVRLGAIKDEGGGVDELALGTIEKTAKPKRGRMYT